MLESVDSNYVQIFLQHLLSVKSKMVSAIVKGCRYRKCFLAF